MPFASSKSADDLLPAQVAGRCRHQQYVRLHAMLTTHDFADIIVVAVESSLQKISDYINKVYDCPLDQNIEIVSQDMQSGSADALRMIKDKIKTDFMVMSCDLLCDIPPSVLIDSYRTLHSSATVLFYERDSTSEQLRQNQSEECLLN